MSNVSNTEESECIFATLGMLVLDELRFPAQDAKFDVVGGSGAYDKASLGARLHASSSQSRMLGWVIHTGDDFPRTVEDHIRSWDIQFLERRIPGRPSTRGELVYQDSTFGPKTFRYKTEPLKTEPKHLVDTPLLSSQSFHLLGSPYDTKIQIKNLLDLRHAATIPEPPIIIWEPAPPSCTPENLTTCLEVAQLVDIFSPNHIELAAFFGIDLSHDEQFDRPTIERLARKFLAHGIGSSKQGTLIIRAGHEGCCIYSRKQKQFVWLPPFHQHSPKVIDPTGAGNAFLGGFAIGLLKTRDDVVAACYGTVASAFAVEQIGLPVLKLQSIPNVNGITNCPELWNGYDVSERLQEYISRVGIVLDD